MRNPFGVAFKPEETLMVENSILQAQIAELRAIVSKQNVIIEDLIAKCMETNEANKILRVNLNEMIAGAKRTNEVLEMCAEDKEALIAAEHEIERLRGLLTGKVVPLN